MKKLRIGFIGNFVPPFSTENERKWSFEKLGHTVIPFQENQTVVDGGADDKTDLTYFMYRPEARLDLLLYSHTHGWEIKGLKELFGKYKDMHIPTVSVHLDRWAWLKRESDIGTEATWFTEYQFMADYSPEAVELYKKHNLNAHYLKAGVVERDCYLAAPDPVRFPHEIVFVGSKGYHSEYPERPALIEFLHRTYGDRFGHYGNDGIRVVRGHDLNVLYASAKIAVGDSCFGGRPNYVSDRYYETRGRGGFLIHPEIQGVDAVGVGFYNPRDLNHLKSVIDLYLEHGELREKMRLDALEHVKKHETYTNRAEQMLDVIFGGKNE